MNKVKFEPNSKGIRDLLRSSEMSNICQRYADAIVSKAGEGYASSAYIGTGRVNVSVRPETYEARKENAENNTLLKALRG